MNDKNCKDCIYCDKVECSADNYSETFCKAYNHKETWKVDKCERYQNKYTYIPPYDYFSV